jgi:inner membrane protein
LHALAQADPGADNPAVDPLTHSLTGAALSRAGLHRTTPLATATLVIAANAPDIDIVTAAAGSYASLALRRGITHGPLAMLLLPFIVTAVILLYDRVRRRRRQADAQPVLAIPTLGLATLGVLSHPALDWMNTYGIRLLMPFSERWFYGDALFIIDPWIWLALSAPLIGAYIATRRQQVLWAVFGLAASALVLAAPQVPVAARTLWVVAVVALVGALWRSRRAGTPVLPVRTGAQVALGCVVAYMLLMVLSDVLASRQVSTEARAAGLEPSSIMVAPVPANPFSGDVVVQTADAYHTGRFGWLRSPRIEWDATTIPRGEMSPQVLATLQLPQVRNYLRWSRFPFVSVQETDGGYLVRFGDARYPGDMRGGLGGITVEVARDLGPAGIPD